MHARLYRALLRIRRVEEEVARVYPTDRIKSPVHLSIGQEAVSVGVCEALLYGHKAGLDMNTVLKSVSTGAAGSKALEVLAPRMLKGDFEPGFFVEHFIKDMGIALAEAEKQNLEIQPVSGEDLQAMVARMFKSPPEVIDAARRAIGAK